MEILQKLKFFPEVQRLIFLNLWATGLRISEVCTLKGGAYYWDGEDAWIKVYQIKMKTEKMIPISLVLYQIMKIYIKKHHIKPTDFLFKSKDGGAYRTGTFVKGFKANCKKYGIHISGETFKTHDYRHTLRPFQYSMLQHRVMQMIRKNDIRDENGELLNFGTHTFRHCYGKKLTEMHIDDWMIARLLGHKTLQSVHHYRKIGNKIMADETRAVREKIDMILMDVVKEWDGYEI